MESRMAYSIPVLPVFHRQKRGGKNFLTRLITTALFPPKEEISGRQQADAVLTLQEKALFAKAAPSDVLRAFPYRQRKISKLGKIMEYRVIPPRHVPAVALQWY